MDKPWWEREINFDANEFKDPGFYFWIPKKWLKCKTTLEATKKKHMVKDIVLLGRCTSIHLLASYLPFSVIRSLRGNVTCIPTAAKFLPLQLKCSRL